MRTRFRIAVFVAMLGLACNAFAQAPTATLVGKVIDQTGANVVGATVAIRNTATNETRTARTESDGQYTVSNLAPGTYDVIISMTGFRPLEEKNLELAADQTARLDANLQVGATTETVTVAADVGLLNTETSTKGDLITPAEVAEIPLNGRNFNDLAFTVAGVQPSEAGAKGASYVAGGSRADSSGVFIDGINDESPRDAGSQISPPLDSLQEFKMETSDYTAQYGRLSGSVVNMVTKSGGNRYHGSLFDYIRNDLFDAEPFNFAAPPAPAKTKLRQNQFGADLSGPISIPHLYNGQDRTFFTLSIEMVRAVTGVISNTIVPTLLERSGDFSQSLGGNPYYFHNPLTNTKAACTATGGPGCLYPAPYDKIPTLDPVAQKLLAYYPKPNISNAPIGQNNFQIVTDKTTLSDNGLVRVDQKLGAKDTLTGLFLRNVSTATNPTSGAPTGFFGDSTVNHSSILALSETRIMTPNLVNDFHYGRTRTVSVEGANDAGTNFALQLGIAGTTANPAFLGFPSFKPSGYASVGDGASDPVEFVVNDYDGSDLVTWIHGKHTFKFGGDIFHVQLFQPTNTDKNGAFTYNGKFTDTTDR